MSVAIMKTKAETALAEGFDRIVAQLPGGSAVRAAREAAMARFQVLGLPHRRVEEWKYTDLRNVLKDAAAAEVADGPKVMMGDLIVALGPFTALELPRVVLVNGVYRADLSNLAGASVEVKSLAEALKTSGEKTAPGLISNGAEADAVQALNTAFAADGTVVRIADGVALDKPLLIVNLLAGPSPCFVASRNVVSVGAKAKASIVELFVTLPGSAGGHQVNTATEIVVGKAAEASHVKVASNQGNATHLANWIATLGPGAQYRGFQFTAGIALARNQIRVTYAGEGGKLDLSGVFLGRGGDHIDTTLVVDHAVPHCESRELFKGVLDGHARGIFQGKIIVRPHAQKTDGKQMSQALMLSPDAEFDSKPELEIYADDVVCGHGATAAEIDPDLLFYCRSRGIPLADARALLIESFIGEATAKVEHEGVREALESLARDWLAAGA